MEKTCTHCSGKFSVTPEDEAMLKNLAPKIGGKTYQLPLPTQCPACRRQRRLVWRNERHLYKRTCSASGAAIISNISPDSPFPVYKKNYWFSDAWNSLDYGRDFDFSKNFQENFAALQREVPRFSIQQQEPMENSEYCNLASNCKDCYYLFDSDFCRDAYYSNVLKRSQNCSDCSFTFDAELCYETVSCSKSYNVRFSRDCVNCSDSSFLLSCNGCKDCCLSVNLRNKQYYFRNKQLSPEEYEKQVKALNLESATGIENAKAELRELSLKYPHQYLQGVQNEEVSGNYISRSKQIADSFDIDEGWDIRYSEQLYRAKDCMDVSAFGEGIEKIYECSAAGLGSQSCYFCFTPVINCHDLFYCDTTYTSSHCFGCVGLNRQSYCILNKQYSKEEYEALVPKIIAHMQKSQEWGEFFSVQLSPFCYNETIASDYFPLTEKEVTGKGWKWRRQKDDIPAVERIIPGAQLPATIDEVPDDVLSWAIECAVSGRPFRIIRQELDFYRQMRLPVPRLHPDIRHAQRMALRNLRILHERKCGKCAKDIRTTYASDMPEQVFCEQCYLQAVD